MDDVFKALADPSRRQLLDQLNKSNGQTLRELCAGLVMARQSVSKHLAVLEAANLVTTERRGREKHHFLNAGPINDVAERWMTRYDRARAAALADLKHTLEYRPMNDRFVYTTFIKTTPEQLWTALTDPAFTKRYWGVSLTSDWKPGSTVTWDLATSNNPGLRNDVTITDDEQVVLISEPPRRLSYTWHTVTPEFVAAFGDDGTGEIPAGDQDFLAKASAERRSKITFEIELAGDLVKLTVTHDDFDPGSILLEGISEGWPAILASLKTLLETGEPLALA